MNDFVQGSNVIVMCPERCLANSKAHWARLFSPGGGRGGGGGQTKIAAWFFPAQPKLALFTAYPEH
jgi:hypothetical protein